jgi:hypothetical protein
LKWENDTEKLQENLELGLGMAVFRFLNGGHYRAMNLSTSRPLCSIRQFYNDKVNFYVFCRLGLSVIFHSCIQEL